MTRWWMVLLLSVALCACGSDDDEETGGGGTDTPEPEPEPLPEASPVAAGQDHTCVIQESGAAYCWGRNLDGELGDGTGRNRRTPVPLLGHSLHALSSLTPDYLPPLRPQVRALALPVGPAAGAQVGHRDGNPVRHQAEGSLLRRSRWAPARPKKPTLPLQKPS